MGDRATVFFKTGDRISPGVYLHWYGGPTYVYAFLAEMERRKCRFNHPDHDAGNFLQVAHDIIGDGENTDSSGAVIVRAPADMSLASLSRVDPGDNGIYVVEFDQFRGSGTYRVLRFASGWNRTLREMSIEKVTAEKRKVSQSDLAVLAAIFADLRPEVAGSDGNDGNYGGSGNKSGNPL